MFCKLAFFVVVAVLLSEGKAALSEFELEVQFEKFKIDFSRIYSSTAEEASRKEIFRTNVNYIYAHNLDAFSGRSTFTLAVNNFTDLTNAEFRQLLRLQTGTSRVSLGRLHTNQSKSGLPTSIDWVSRNAVTAPINQGQCGSSWAIPVVSAVEGQAAIKTGKLVALSIQQMIDCCSGDDQGCNGGSEDAGYQCIINQGGLDTAAAYPYSGDQDSCHFRSKYVGARIVGWTDLAPNSEAALENAVGTVGPVAGAVDASQSSFQFYSSGVYVEPACSQNVDHGVSVVGYGALGGQQYWKLKNSWGQAWGMGGYMLIGRNMGNMCGVASANSYPHEIQVTQNRFLATGDVKPEEDKILYPVFLGLKTSNGLDESLVLDERSKTLKLPTSDDFFKINGDQAGIYRTAYESSRWSKLGKAGVDGKLSVEDRVGLVADAGSLASSGFVSTTDFLNLVKSWSNESNYVVWDEILTRIGTIKAAFIFEPEEIKDALNTFTIDLIGDKLRSVGWEFSEKDSFADQQLKSSLFASAANAGHKESVEYAKNCFKKFVDGDKKAIHPNLRTSIFNTVAKNGNSETFDQLFNIYKNPQSVEEKISALRSLGRFSDEAILDKVTGLLLKTDIVKAQDIYIPMQGLRSHRLGIEKLWTWLTINWDEVYKLLPPGLSMLGSVVTLASCGFTKKEQKEKVQSFFKSKNTKGFDQGLAQSMDMITAKSAWATRDSDAITKWLSSNGYSK